MLLTDAILTLLNSEGELNREEIENKISSQYGPIYAGSIYEACDQLKIAGKVTHTQKEDPNDPDGMVRYYFRAN